LNRLSLESVRAAVKCGAGFVFVFRQTSLETAFDEPDDLRETT